MLLLTPGPTPVPEVVRTALARPMIHHRTPEFVDLYRRTTARLARVCRCAGPAFVLPGSATTAFEAAQLSFAKAGDTVVSCAFGRFGERWQETYDRAARFAGLRNVRVSAPWGETIRPEALADTLRKHPGARAVTVVHCDTSTAAACDLRALAAVVRREAPDAMLIVDAVSSLGALPLEADAWGVDVIVAGTQKALMCPPGAAVVGLSARAADRLRAITADECLAPMSMALQLYLAGHEHAAPPFTPPVSHYFALEAALGLIESQGLERVWADTAMKAAFVRERLVALGFTFMSNAPSDAVTGAFYPPGVDASLRRRVAERHGIVLADGQDQFKGRGIRFSHMGAVTMEETRRGVEAIAQELSAVRA